MKHAAILLFLILATAFRSAEAQHIALGERVPELRNVTWLDDRRPAEAAATYIEFYHSSNGAAASALDRLQSLADGRNPRLRIIVVTKEPADRIARLLRPYLSPHLSVALDPSGRFFEACGVHYLPFGLLTDARNRVVWMGNTLRMDDTTYRQLMQ